jgi:hypothetical protein
MDGRCGYIDVGEQKGYGQQESDVFYDKEIVILTRFQN